MANSESDSNKPKDDQAETPEENEETSDAEHSDVEETDETSPDGEDADGESTEEHSDDPQTDAADASDEDDEVVDRSDDEDEDDEDHASDGDDDESDEDEEAEASDDGEDESDEDDASDQSDDEDTESSDDEESETVDSDDADGSASDEEDDSAEASTDEEDTSDSDGAADEGTDDVSDGDDHDETPDPARDGDILMTERFVEDATGHENSTPGIAAFFDHPDDLMEAARRTRDSDYEQFDAFSPFPIHGMDEAMGLGRSWIPWVTFGAGLFGFLCAVALEFGTMTFDWPMIIGGKPFAPWPAFVPVMFELTVLIGGVTTGVVMLKAAGCFQPAEVIDPDLTNDRFALWISADDAAYDRDEVVEFVRSLNPTEVRTFTEKADSDA